MKPKVVLYHPVPADTLSKLQESFDLTVFPKADASNRDEFLKAVQEADGIIGMGLKIPTTDLRAGKNLKAIATITAGYDDFDVAELTSRRIVLMNLFDPLTETTADLAFTLLMSTARRVVELDGKVRAGQWTKGATKEWFGLDIHGKTLGIVGLGRIGSAIARRGALGCGMSVLYTARSPKPDQERDYGARRCELDELLIQSDFVCIAVPLNADTTRLIGAREINLMKSSSILVNIARGAVVDEAALADALRDGTIYGAGLDVFEREPLSPESPLIGLPNVVLLPHIGSATQETRDAMARYAGETLIGYLCHGKARNVVNPDARIP